MQRTLTEKLRSLSIETRERGEHEHAREGWTQIDCPFCSPNSYRFRLGIHQQTRATNCWNCGKHSFFESLHLSTNIPYARLAKIFAEADFHIPRERKKNTVLEVPENLGELGAFHKNYLRDRGFDPQEIKDRWGIRGVGWNGGKWSWVIWIPIHSRGRVVSWTCRAIHALWRYRSAAEDQEIISHKTLLYGEEYTGNTIIVVEGPTDVWRIEPGAVSLFGAAYTPSQVEKISRYPIRYICLDSEARSQNRALCDELSVLPGETYEIRDLDAKDPGEASEKDLKSLRDLVA